MIVVKQISHTIIKILLIIIIINFAFIPTSEASFWGDIFQQGDDFIADGKSQGAVLDGDKMKKEIDHIYNILLALGVGLSVLVGAVLGIKYMFGSIEEQAKVKETLFPYIIGCIVVFSAFAIWKLAIEILSQIS